MVHKQILVVDDEKKIVDIVRSYLERDGYRVIVAYDGKSALYMARSQSPDLIVLDLMLPEVSGWDVCRTLRTESNVPIVMVTARDDDSDKIIGLELGADDYVVKPFNPKELVSRVRAVLRRAEGAVVKTKRLEIADLSIDLERHEVKRGENIVELTPTEFALLRILAEAPGHVYSRVQLLEKVQGIAYEGYERAIDSHIKNLRKKLEPDPNSPRYIATVWGVGYKLADGKNA